MLPTSLKRVEVSYFALVFVALVLILKVVGGAVEEWCLRVLP
jgi:hypothetical protein